MPKKEDTVIGWKDYTGIISKAGGLQSKFNYSMINQVLKELIDSYENREELELDLKSEEHAAIVLRELLITEFEFSPRSIECLGLLKLIELLINLAVNFKYDSEEARRAYQREFNNNNNEDHLSFWKTQAMAHVDELEDRSKKLREANDKLKKAKKEIKQLKDKLAKEKKVKGLRIIRVKD